MACTREPRRSSGGIRSPRWPSATRSSRSTCWGSAAPIVPRRATPPGCTRPCWPTSSSPGRPRRLYGRRQRPVGRAAHRARRARPGPHRLRGPRRTHGVAHLREPTATRQRRRPAASSARRSSATRCTTASPRPRGCATQLRAMYFDDRLVTPELVECYVRSAQQPGVSTPSRALLDGGSMSMCVPRYAGFAFPPCCSGATSRVRTRWPMPHAFRVLKHDLEWTLVRDAGDLPHDERSDEVNATLRSFLERTRRWSGSPEPAPGDGLTVLRPDRDTDSHRLAAFVIFRPLCRIRR